MSTASPYTIFVNSSDGFEDCWQPFFELFNQYWPGVEAPILLNTERKHWTYPGLDLRCTRVQKGDGGARRLTWSECLQAGLQQVATPLVLYLQEDYFIERRVLAELIRELAVKMVENPTIRHIGLTHFGGEGPFRKTDDLRLWEIPPRARYRISAQAGLWRVEALLSYLLPWENGWMFEIFGTRRAWRRHELFLTLNRDVFNPKNTPAIQYLHTGIIKGKWHTGIQEVFSRHGIMVNFRERGFHRQRPALIRRLDLLRKIAAHPVYVAKSLFG